MHPDEFSTHQKQDPNGRYHLRVRHIKLGVEASESFPFISRKKVIKKINELQKKVMMKIAEEYSSRL